MSLNNNKPLTIIGLVGKKQSGKDTTFKILEQLCVERNVVRLAFADALKLEVSNIIEKANPSPGFEGSFRDESIAWMDELKYKLPEFRKLLQDYGTRMRQEFGDDYWIKQTAAQIQHNVSQLKPTIIVITDCRYANEAAWINSQGGVLWRIRRPDVDKENTDTHSSETELESISPDRVFYNSGDIKQYAGSIYLSIRHFKLTFGQNIKHYEDIDYEQIVTK
jgi:hypothetical protein